MAIDLSKMSEKELGKLSGDIERELKGRDKDRMANARKAAEDAAKKHGFSLTDLMGGSQKGARKPQATPRFRNPENPDQTWSGRGRQPEWFKSAIQNGSERDALAI